MRKNSKQLKAILARPGLTGQHYTLENSFNGQEMRREQILSWFDMFYRSITVSRRHGNVVLSHHSNSWVEIPE